MPSEESESVVYRVLPIVAGIAGSIPAGIIHRGLEVGPYPSLAVGGMVALAIFAYGDMRLHERAQRGSA